MQSKHFRNLLLLCCLIGGGSLYSSMTVAQQTIEHVLIITVDGLRPDAITTLGETGAPHLNRLLKEGSSTLNARTDHDYTNTIPNHTSMITGRGVSGATGHNYTLNYVLDTGTLHEHKKKYVASLFDTAHDHGLSTGLFASKLKFNIFTRSYGDEFANPDTTGDDNGKNKLDHSFLSNKNSVETFSEFFTVWKDSPLNLTFLHLAETDKVGHASSWDLNEGSKYIAAVKQVDYALGLILDDLDKRPELKEKTVLIMTADHGGIKTNHTNNSISFNYTIPFIVYGAGVTAGTDLYQINMDTYYVNPFGSRINYNTPYQPIRNSDAANLALKLLGLPAITGSTIGQKQVLKVTEHGIALGLNKAFSSTETKFSPVLNSIAGDQSTHTPTPNIEMLNLGANVSIDPAHQGKEARIIRAIHFIADEGDNNVWLYYEGDHLVTWNGDLNALIAENTEMRTLKAEEYIQGLSGNFAGMAGLFDVYIGYYLMDEELIVFNGGNPIHFSVPK